MNERSEVAAANGTFFVESWAQKTITLKDSPMFEEFKSLTQSKSHKGTLTEGSYNLLWELLALIISHHCLEIPPFVYLCVDIATMTDLRVYLSMVETSLHRQLPIMIHIVTVSHTVAILLLPSEKHWNLVYIDTGSQLVQFHYDLMVLLVRMFQVVVEQISAVRIYSCNTQLQTEKQICGPASFFLCLELICGGKAIWSKFLSGTPSVKSVRRSNDLAVKSGSSLKQTRVDWCQRVIPHAKKHMNAIRKRFMRLQWLTEQLVRKMPAPTSPEKTVQFIKSQSMKALWQQMEHEFMPDMVEETYTKLSKRRKDDDESCKFM